MRVVFSFCVFGPDVAATKHETGTNKGQTDGPWLDLNIWSVVWGVPGDHGHAQPRDTCRAAKSPQQNRLLSSVYCMQELGYVWTSSAEIRTGRQFVNEGAELGQPITSADTYSVVESVMKSDADMGKIARVPVRREDPGYKSEQPEVEAECRRARLEGRLEGLKA